LQRKTIFLTLVRKTLKRNALAFVLTQTGKKILAKNEPEKISLKFFLAFLLFSMHIACQLVSLPLLWKSCGLD